MKVGDMTFAQLREYCAKQELSCINCELGTKDLDYQDDEWYCGFPIEDPLDWDDDFLSIEVSV